MFRKFCTVGAEVDGDYFSHLKSFEKPVLGLGNWNSVGTVFFSIWSIFSEKHGKYFYLVKFVHAFYNKNFNSFFEFLLTSILDLDVLPPYVRSTNICSYVRHVRERTCVNTCSSMFEVNVCSQTCSFGNLTTYSTSLELSRTNRVNF